MELSRMIAYAILTIPVIALGSCVGDVIHRGTAMVLIVGGFALMAFYDSFGGHWVETWEQGRKKRLEEHYWKVRKEEADQALRARVSAIRAVTCEVPARQCYRSEFQDYTVSYRDEDGLTHACTTGPPDILFESPDAALSRLAHWDLSARGPCDYCEAALERQLSVHVQQVTIYRDPPPGARDLRKVERAGFVSEYTIIDRCSDCGREIGPTTIGLLRSDMGSSVHTVNTITGGYGLERQLHAERSA